MTLETVGCKGMSLRPDALIKDEKAMALVKQMRYDFSRIKMIIIRFI